MNKIIKRLRSLIALTCAVLAFCAAARAQNSSLDNKTQTSESARNQQISESSHDEVKSFYRLTEMTPNALAAGETDKAKQYAEELLKQAETFRKNWNYGNAVHAANIVLGKIALDSGNLDEAKHFLLEAGKTPGSPQLDSFGPDMSLAKNLLEKGEREIIIEYFEFCAKFWNSGGDKLTEWKTAVLNKETPKFGPNLVYYSGDSPRTNN